MPEGAQRAEPLPVAGILLAAGRGERFDPSGKQNKLMQALPQGGGVAVAAAHALLQAASPVFAAVRPGADELAAQLRQAGCVVAVCPAAERGMGATLAFAVGELRLAGGWIIALADMPYVRPATLTALASALQQGADMAAPVYQGRRGNPVGFGRKHLEHLLALGGDKGARDLLRQYPVTEIEVDDPGVLRDIDIPADLR